MTTDTWLPLSDLRNGAIFETQDGVRAVKSEYHYSNENPQPLCILLASGEFAHFPDKERTLVRELTFAAAEAAAYERAARTICLRCQSGETPAYDSRFAAYYHGSALCEASPIRALK